MAAPSYRYLMLDHWRGLACLAVLVNHAVWYRSGSALELTLFDVAARLWLGVPVFFVISGYCITAAVEAHRARPGGRLRDYFTRRLRRIYPPYWVALGATLLIIAVVDVGASGAPLSSSGEFLRPWWYDGRQWLGNLTLTEIWRGHVVPGQKALMLSHAWTLCYEEQFYVVAGLLLWSVPGRFFHGTLFVTLATVAAALTVAPARIDGFFFDGSWLQFWFGVVVFYALRGGSRARIAALLLFAASAIAASADWQRLLEPDKNGPQAFLIASLFAAALVLLHRYDERLARARVLAPLQICGVMCYSLYLVHLPIVKLLRAGFTTWDLRPTPYASMIVAAPICLAVAWGFHRTVERHFLNTRPRPVLAPAAIPGVRTA